MFGVALSLAAFSLVERQPSQADSDDAVKLLDHSVFGVAQNCWCPPSNIVFERQSDAARIYQQTTVMLSKHLYMRMPAGSNRRRCAGQHRIERLRRRGCEDVLHVRAR